MQDNGSSGRGQKAVPSGATSYIRGFTLIEFAVVVCIAVLVLSAIWAAVSQVNSRRLVAQTADTVWDISRNIRDAYTGHTATSSLAAMNNQASQVTAGLFPASALIGAPPAPYTPWGGAISVWFNNATNPWQFNIVVAFNGAPAANVSDCVNLIGRLNPTPLGDDGGPINAYLNGGGTSALGMSPTTIAAVLGGNCTQVRFVFNL